MIHIWLLKSVANVRGACELPLRDAPSKFYWKRGRRPSRGECISWTSFEWLATGKFSIEVPSTWTSKGNTSNMVLIGSNDAVLGQYPPIQSRISYFLSYRKQTYARKFVRLLCKHWCVQSIPIQRLQGFCLSLSLVALRVKFYSHTQGNKWRDGNLVNVGWELTVEPVKAYTVLARIISFIKDNRLFCCSLRINIGQHGVQKNTWHIIQAWINKILKYFSFNK